MPQFLLSFHGGKPAEAPEEQAASMTKWGEWYGRLGEALVDGGDAVGERAWISADGDVTRADGTNPVTGYSVIEADDLDDAIELASDCPVRDNGGSIEVGTLLGLMADGQGEVVEVEMVEVTA